MKKQASRSSDALCFCEYDNIKGERSHLMATLCDCDVIDSLCDSCLRCQPVPEEKLIQAVETIEDRIRLPFCNGRGAIKMNFELAYPAITLPFTLCLAAYGPYWTFFSLLSFFTVLIISSRLCRYRKRNRLFFATTLSSSIYLFAVFIVVVVGFRKILLWEILLMATLYLITLYLMFQVKHNSNLLRVDRKNYRNPEKLSSDGRQLNVRQVSWIDSRPIIDDNLQLFCGQCKVDRPPRSGHCTRCDCCIFGRDHHCIWLDVCIGKHNHRSFFLFLFMFFTTGVYGVHLTTTTLCTPVIYLDWFLVPADCRFLYTDFPSGLCVCSVVLSCIGLSFILCLLVQQFVLISQNLTSQEYHRARQRGWLKCWGLLALHNSNDKGFLKNWYNFLRNKRTQRYKVAVATDEDV
ncbi:hypothetical protein HELRODRAFT_190925 [Helobdella robusta]|uniref:Palmitoyltransferase n=1 Tax=Helobdella robusta TaxID=6412 RepID=T1FSF3_HELRO|nr:hypothetical protein HELRODRAFT_190925 [Helobdella robusta]ESO08176.1 hypothetical protein HELRODRAFT_190925 [Helobdella robusta]